MGGLSINGRGGGFNFSYDGVTNKDTGSNSGNYAAPALDSIAEVRVQTSNFQAEYGRSSGATITVVTRSGTKDFHGSAAFYKRDDCWNGNEFQRRQQCDQGVTAQCDPPLYTFDNTAWTLGGPVLIPGSSFNRSRNKLFFFFSQDVLSRTDPGNLNQRRMPTELERRGDFSQTVDQNGQSAFGSAIRSSRETAAPRQAARRASPTTSSRETASTRSARRCSICFHCRTPSIRPAATSTTTRTRPCRTGRGTIRCCAWTGTWRRTPRCTAGCSSAMRSAPAASRSSVPAAAGRSSRASTRSTRSAT